MRLIDADKLKEKAVPLLFPTKMEPCGHIPVPVQAVVVAEIEQAPTIEAEPVRHGRWAYVGRGCWECSECKRPWPVPLAKAPAANGCPNCRAKMDGE